MNAPIEYAEWFPADAKTFVSALLTRDSAARPTADQMKEYAWFDPIDWTKLAMKGLKPPFNPAVKDAQDLSEMREELLAEKATEEWLGKDPSEPEMDSSVKVRNIQNSELKYR